MTLEGLADGIRRDLGRRLLTGRTVLGKVSFLGDISEGELNDRTYLPFYYYLGRHWPANKILQVNINEGLKSLAYARGCGHTPSVTGVQITEHYFTPRFAKANLRRCDILDRLPDDKFDLIIVDKEFDTNFLDSYWSLLNHDGLLVQDGIVWWVSDFEEYATLKNRHAMLFDTKYMVGMIQR